MKPEYVAKYRPYPQVDLKDRTWPNNTITQPPTWCSVDLRDGNQALIVPMNLEQKLELFQLLVKIGFKEIEVGFPSAAKVEYDFLRALVDGNYIPDDVTVQVLTQAREHLITKTFEALKGTKRAILHLYNSTSTLQREVVFRKPKDDILQLAVDGVRLVKELAKDIDTEIVLEYSPESFTGTELDFARDVCDAVCEEWGATPEKKMIINLPATVEMSTANIYADQMEWMHRNLARRDSIILSIHNHNDRGTAVAAAELALMAGGDRIEGTLFGNGERTGNVDVVNLAMNMYSQGVDPGLDLHNLSEVVEVAERVTKIPVGFRHPYAGELVYTAFSGSHQDAIKKGIDEMNALNRKTWAVPYLPIDPGDVGRNYEAIIRINSQSGKGGVAYILQTDFGCRLPKDMHPEFGSVVQNVAEGSGKEVMPDEIWNAFENEYLKPGKHMALEHFKFSSEDGRVEAKVTYTVNGESREAEGQGNGPIDACKTALIEAGDADFTILSFDEHSLETGSEARAIAYIQIQSGAFHFFGAGIDTNITQASIKALFSALNRAKGAGKLRTQSSAGAAGAG